jgi:hypothetical protein
MNPFEEITEGLRQIQNATIKVGVFAEENSELAIIAGVHEFGARIRPKGKYLAIPIHSDAEGKSPRSFSGLQFRRKKGSNSAILGKSEGGSFVPFFVLVKEVVIPERAWLRTTFQQGEYLDQLRNEIQLSLFDFLEGVRTPEQVLHSVGTVASSLVKKRLQSNEPAMQRLSGLTVRMKGHDRPLLGKTLQLRNAIGYEVVP